MRLRQLWRNRNESTRKRVHHRSRRWSSGNSYSHRNGYTLHLCSVGSMAHEHRRIWISRRKSLDTGLANWRYRTDRQCSYLRHDWPMDRKFSSNVERKDGQGLAMDVSAIIGEELKAVEFVEDFLQLR